MIASLRLAFVTNVFVAVSGAPAGQAALIAETAHEESLLNWCWSWKEGTEECKDIPYAVVKNAVPNVAYSLASYILDPNFAKQECSGLGEDCCFLQMENQELDALEILYDAGTPSDKHSSFGFLGRQDDGTLVLSIAGTDFKDTDSIWDSVDLLQKTVYYGTKRTGFEPYTVHEGAHKAWMEFYEDHEGYAGRHDDPSRPDYDTLGKTKLNRAIYKAVTGVEGPVKMLVTGHSLGGAMASLAAIHLINVYKTKLQIKLVTIGAYRVLKTSDAYRVQQNLVQHATKFGVPFPDPGFLSVQRWVNAGDLVPSIIPSVTPLFQKYSHFGNGMLIMYDTLGTSGKRQWEFTQRSINFTPYHGVVTSYPRHMSMNYLRRMQKGQCPATDLDSDAASEFTLSSA